MNRQPVIVNDHADFAADDNVHGRPRVGNVRALLDVPILVEGAVHGVLCLQHRDVRYWDEDDAGFANTTGLIAGLSMEATQRQEAETRIEHLAWYDALTACRIATCCARRCGT